MARESRTFGINACLAVHRARPEHISRAWVTEEAIDAVSEMLRDLARRRRPYRVVDAEELGRVAGATHHEGVCIQAHEPNPPTLEELVGRLPEGPVRVLLLDGVRNPHNLGAILRVAAHFGVAGIVGVRGVIPAPTGAARRVAQGAAEHVPVVAAGGAMEALDALDAAGLVAVATAADAGEGLFEAELPARSVLMLGAERSGLSDQVRGRARVAVAIRGTGLVESLNVSTACAVVLAEHWRRYAGGSP